MNLDDQDEFAARSTINDLCGLVTVAFNDKRLRLKGLAMLLKAGWVARGIDTELKQLGLLPEEKK